MRRRFLSFHAVLPAVLAGSLLIGCGDDDGDDDDDDRPDSGQQLPDAGGDAGRTDAGMDAATSMDAGPDGAASPDAGTLTDNQVIGIVAAINMGEIQAGEIASTKGTNAAVKSFAMSMVTMHMAAQTRQNALNISAATSPVQMMLMTEAATLQQMLNSAQMGPQFDLLYINSQVTMHMMALDLIDDTLLNEASAAALRTELMTARAEVQMHYNQAVQIRNQLTSDGGVGDGGTTADAGGIDSGT